MLDNKTLMVVLTFVVLVASTALHVTWRLNRSVAGIREWSLGFLAISAGIVLLASQQVVHPLFSLILADTLIIAGYYFIWRGVRLFKGTVGLYTRPYVAVIGLVAAAISYLTFVAEQPSLRILLVTWVIATQLLVLAREFFVNMPYANAATRLTGVSCSLHFVIHATLGLIILFGPRVESLFDQVFATQLIFLGGFNTAILLAFGLIIMTTARLQIDLERQAARDPLTGAMNRRAFFATAEPILARSQRAPESMTLLVIDLDNFKIVNDTYGHAVGDEVLKQFVQVARSTLRGQDILARFGGEEFVILLPNTTPTQAMEGAERLRTAFSRSCAETGTLPAATVSIGLAGYQAGDDKLDDMIARADQALYAAKEHGRDRVEAYLPA